MRRSRSPFTTCLVPTCTRSFSPVSGFVFVSYTGTSSINGVVLICCVISMYWSCAMSNLASASQSTFAISLISSNSFAIFRNFFFCSGVKYDGGFTLSFGATTSAFFRASISAFVRCFRPFITTKSVGCLCPAM